MKRYRVISRYAPFAPGAILGLSKEQAAMAGVGLLKVLGGGRYEVLTRTGLPQGQDFGVDKGLPVAWERYLSLVYDPAKGNGKANPKPKRIAEMLAEEAKK